MMILNIEKIGSSALKKLAQLVTTEEIQTEAMQKLISAMISTMRYHEGVGIAAPQVSVNKQIICVGGYEKNKRYPEQPPVPLIILINPQYEPYENNFVDDAEGCLSIPGKRGTVARFQKIKYSGYDQYGSFIDAVAEDFFARIIQHEIDHLNGILFIEKAKDIVDI